MAKNDLRWVEREHTGTVGDYLLADCADPDCTLTSVLVALVGGEVHLRAERKCQHCGAALTITEKEISAAIKARRQPAK